MININFILYVVVVYVTDRPRDFVITSCIIQSTNFRACNPNPPRALPTKRGNQMTLMNEDSSYGINANLVPLFVIYRSRIITFCIHRCNSAKNAVDDVIPKYIPPNSIAERRREFSALKWRESNFRDAGK